MILQINGARTELAGLDEEDENSESSCYYQTSALPESAWRFHPETLKTDDANTSGKKRSMVDLIPVFGEATLAELMAASPQAGEDMGMPENSTTPAIDIAEVCLLCPYEISKIQHTGISGVDGNNSINAITLHIIR